MAFLHTWALSISGAVIIGAVCEMLMPEGDLKKYARLILGIVLIVIIVRPISRDWGQAFYSGEVAYQTNVAAVSPDAAAKNMDDQVMSLYKKQLADAMKADLSAQIKGYAFEVQIESDGSGNISSAAVMLTSTGSGGDLPAAEGKAVQILTEKYGVDKSKITLLH